MDNQRVSLSEAVSRGFVLGIDCADPVEIVRSCGPLVARLLREPDLRRNLSETCLALYDGGGKSRVIGAMEMRLDGGR